MRTLLLLALGFGLLWAEPSAFFTDLPSRADNAAQEEPAADTYSDGDALYSDEPEVTQKVLYLSYVSLPERVIRGEIFPITVRVLSTEDHFEDIAYAFENGSGYRLLDETPQRREEGHYFYDTFYCVATGATLVTPTLTASLKYSDFHATSPTTLAGKKLEVITLNPPADYANVLAEQFEITDYKTTRYNRSSNIVVFSAAAKRCDIETLKLGKVEKQGIESVQPSPDMSQITYYAIIPSKYENFRFSYFNLKTERFKEVLIPIIVEDDSVSTQSDLKPTEHKHTRIKIAVAAVVGALALILFIFRRKYLYLVFVALPALYIAYAAVPIEYACIKSGSPIYLLPMENGTTFEMTEKRMLMEVQGHVDGFTKVKLENSKIGWIRNEDLCLR